MFKTTLLLLDIAKPAQLDSYAELIRKQSEEHGPTCWSIIYQADVRMRSEEFDRIRRRMSIDFYKLEPAARLVSYFNPADPWNTIFQLSHPDASHKADRFWQVEVKDKCTAYLTQIRTWNQVMDDGASPWPWLPKHVSGRKAAASSKQQPQQDLELVRRVTSNPELAAKATNAFPGIRKLHAQGHARRRDLQELQ